ncbi:MAG: ADYC domain-containing protein [Polyangiaceae bacterium]|nr:ADYC domain-containing protein [Polyangiaceae bacterium]
MAAQACAPSDQPEAEGQLEPSVEIATAEGMRPSGVSINGVSINGVSINGVSINGVSINGVSINGVSGSELVGETADGTPYGGAAFVGAELEGELPSDTLPLRVDGARAAGDVWYYKISYDAGSGWQSLCGLDGGGNPVEAVALAGRWNMNQGVPDGGAWINDPAAFTFGCRTAALAKCVDLGYKPWASAGAVSLRDHHQACTRMLRADYCGDGRSWTVNGTPINLYDGIGIQNDTTSWKIEAEWTATGARFITTSSSQARLKLTTGTPPACFTQRVSSATGDLAHFSTGTLLMSEFEQTDDDDGDD